MSKYEKAELTNMCMIYDGAGRVVVQDKVGKSWGGITFPGGHVEKDESFVDSVIREVKEETGLDAAAEKLIAVQDWRKHNRCNLPYGVVKIFVLCKALGGSFEDNIETTEIRYFGKDELPDSLAVEKTTEEQIRLCFEAYESEKWETVFE